MANNVQVKEPPQTKRIYLDIPNAAGVAGISVRHFRRVLEEDNVSLMRIKRKFFITGPVFNDWSRMHFNPRHVHHQLDREFLTLTESNETEFAETE